MLVERSRVEPRERVLRFGIREGQARTVLASAQGYTDAARRLGVCIPVVHEFEAQLGMRVRGYRAPFRPERCIASDDQVLEAILSPLSLTAAARTLGISGTALHVRARRLGLPTAAAARAALRSGAAA